MVGFIQNQRTQRALAPRLLNPNGPNHRAVADVLTGRGLPGDRYVSPQSRYAQMLLSERSANNGTVAGGLADAAKKLMAGYLMGQDRRAQESAQAALVKGLGPQTSGHPGTDQTTMPGGFDSVASALGGMPDNPYAQRLTSQLLMSQALQRGQQADADQGRIGELRTRKIAGEDKRPYELTEKYSGSGQWESMGDPVPLWKPEGPQTDPDILEMNQLIEAMGQFPEGDPRRAPYQSRLTKITSATPAAQINMNPGEPKANEELGKAIGTRLASQLESGDKAMSNLQTLSLMESAAAQLEQGGGSVGALAEPQAFASSILQAANVDPTSLGLPADAGPAQVLNSLGNKLTLGKIGGADGMPANNFSDADRKFIESTVPRLTDTPSAFKAKIFIDKRMAERSIQVAQEIDRLYSEGASASEMSKAVSAIKSAPLFNSDETASIRASSGSADATTPAYSPASAAQPRKKVIRNPETGALEFAQ